MTILKINVDIDELR